MLKNSSMTKNLNVRTDFETRYLTMETSFKYKFILIKKKLKTFTHNEVTQ